MDEHYGSWLGCWKATVIAMLRRRTGSRTRPADGSTPAMRCWSKGSDCPADVRFSGRYPDVWLWPLLRLHECPHHVPRPQHPPNPRLN